MAKAPPPITTINHPTINTKYSSVFLRIFVFFDEMIENLPSPILLHVVRIRWLVIKVMTFLPQIILTSIYITSSIALSRFLLDYIQISITAVFFFCKNSYVDGKTEKLIQQPQKVACISYACTYFLCIRYKKCKGSFTEKNGRS